MRDFDDHFRLVSNGIRSTQRMALVMGVVWFAVVFGVLGFVGWVIVKVMQHFGVI